MYRILLILLLCSLGAKAQKPFSRDFYLNESGTPVKVNAIVQDSIGYMWLGTDDGLYRYNGITFNKISDSVHKAVTAITTVDDKVWLAFANGKTGTVDNSFISLNPVKNTRPAASANCICANRLGTLWVGTEDQGLYTIAGNTGINLDEDNGLSDNFVYTISVLPDGHFLLGTDNGINEVSLAKGKVRVSVLTTDNGLPDNIVRVIKKVPHSGLYMIGTQESGIAFYTHDNEKIWVPSGPKWSWGQVNDILPLSSSHAWAVTEDGYLLDLNFKDSTHLDISPAYLPGKKLKKILIDKSGNIWIATNIGLTMVTAEYLSYIPLSAPYLLRTVTAITCDKDSLLWFAQGKDLFSIALNKTDPAPVHVLQTKAPITSLYVDYSNRLWIGTFGQGLLYKNAGTGKVNETGIVSLEKESILNIAGTDSILWIAGLNGVEELSYPDREGGHTRILRHHGKISGVGSDYVYQLYPDRKQNIWMATDGAGVCMYDGGYYKHWNNVFKANGGVAYSIAEDIYDNMWVGAFKEDLYRFRNNKWVNVRKYETHSIDMGISSVCANGTGQVISVYQRCIDEWFPKSQRFRHFNNRMHIGIDSTSGIVNCIAKDKDGNVYVPFEKGIAIFKNLDSTYDVLPTVHIAGISLDLQHISKSKKYFKHNENYLSFYINGINYTNPERLNYRYMLKGYNNNWVSTNDEAIIFPQLPPGRYKFRIQASLSSDFSNAAEDSYSFVITLPLWRKSWFIILSGLVCFILVYLYIKQREKRIQNLSLLEQERMMFEYEHLKSQVNPHFLFNSLNTLTSLIDENKDTAISYTEHLSDLYRNMLTYRNQDLIKLSEEWEILSDYIHIQQSRFGEALQLKVNIPESVMQTKSIVPLALQLLVENAIKHNVVSNSEPLIIHISADDEKIIVKNAIRPKISKEKGAGLGLNNIRKRYKLLTNRRVIYGVQENEYIVILPLL